MLRKLIESQYVRNDAALGRGRFRVKGDILEVQPANVETAYRSRPRGRGRADHALRPAERRGVQTEDLAIWPATEDATSKPTIERAVSEYRAELESQVKQFETEAVCLKRTPDPAAHRGRPRADAGARLLQRDRELLADSTCARRARTRSRCSTTSRTTSATFIDESHQTVPQIGGMHEGRPLAQEGAPRRLRLPAAVGARQPAAAVRRVPRTGAAGGASVSAKTPGAWELRQSTRVAEQLIRPTYLVDPEIELRPTKNQIDDLLNEIRRREDCGGAGARHDPDEEDVGGPQRLPARGRVSRRATCIPKIDTLERIQIIRELRLGDYDVLVGVNLLREGLNLPGGLAGGDLRRRQGGLPAGTHRARPDRRPARPGT